MAEIVAFIAVLIGLALALAVAALGVLGLVLATIGAALGVGIVHVRRTL